MLRSLRIRGFGLLVILLIGVAFAFAGAAHRLPPKADPDLEAYLAIGGEIEGLCGLGSADQGTSPADCPLCHLVAAFSLPQATDTVRDVELRFVAEIVAPNENRSVRAVLDPGQGTRAPPLA